MRKEAKIIIAILSILLLVGVAWCGFSIFKHFTSDDTKTVTLNSTSMNEAKGYEVSVNSTDNALRIKNQVDVQLLKSVYVPNLITDISEDLFDTDTRYNKVFKEDMSDKKNKAIINGIESNSGFVLIRTQLKNSYNVPKVFTSIDLQNEDNEVIGSSSLIAISKVVGEKEKSTKKDSFALSYDYLAGTYSEEEGSYSVQGMDISPVTFAALGLIDTVTPLLPGEVREGNLLVRIDRKWLSDTSLKAVHNSYTEQSNKGVQLTKVDENPTKKSFQYYRQIVAKTNSDTIHKKVKEKAVGDLLYGSVVKATKTSFSSKGVDLQVESVKFYANDYADKSQLMGYSSVLGLDRMKGIYAIKVKAKATKKSAIATFTVAGKKVEPYLVGRKNEELPPEVKSNFNVLEYLGMDTEPFKETVLPNMVQEDIVEPTEPLAFNKGDEVEGYLFVSGDAPKGSLAIEYK